MLVLDHEDCILVGSLSHTRMMSSRFVHILPEKLDTWGGPNKIKFGAKMSNFGVKQVKLEATTSKFEAKKSNFEVEKSSNLGLLGFVSLGALGGQTTLASE